MIWFEACSRDNLHWNHFMDLQKQNMFLFLYALSVWGQQIFMLGSKIEACKPPKNDLKVVSVIEMTFLYDARYSLVLLRQKVFPKKNKRP